jgi:hypothetical protein
MDIYEAGMAVFHDCVTKAVFIEFRGRLHYLVGPFTNSSAGITAGEQKCRDLGWAPAPRKEIS